MTRAPRAALGPAEWLCLAVTRPSRSWPADGSGREPDGQALFLRARGAAERNGHHVPAHERVPFAALADMGPGCLQGIVPIEGAEIAAVPGAAEQG